MKARKKNPILLCAAAAAVIAVITAIWAYFDSDPWGFARTVSPEDRARRLVIVETAESYLGCREADGSHEKIIDLYNSHEPHARDYEVTYTDSWCAAFVSAVSIECQMTDIIPPECGCEQQILLFQAMDCWQERDDYLPLPGDIIYYAWDEPVSFGDCTGWSDHVGIVVGTAGPFIKVVEGNKDDCVSYRYIPWNHMDIRGYGLPAYG